MAFQHIVCLLLMVNTIQSFVLYETILTYYVSVEGECQGHDMFNFPTLDLKQCAFYCWHYPTCDGFAYFDVPIGHEKGRCHIKQPHSNTRCHEHNTYSDLTVRTYHLNMESGHASLAYYYKMQGDCAGHEISSTRPLTEEQCAFQCWKHKSCDSFVYEFQNKTCILKYPIMENWCPEPDQSVTYYYAYYGTWHYGNHIGDHFAWEEGDCDIQGMGHKTGIRDYQCAALCWNTPFCDGFVFGYTGESDKGCYIKHPGLQDHCNVPTEKEHFYTFYLMDEITTNITTAFDKMDGDCPGSLMGYKSYLNVEECASYCWNNYDCDGFVYSFDNNNMFGCHLKLPSIRNWCPEPMPSPDVYTYYIKEGACHLEPCHPNNTYMCNDIDGGFYDCDCYAGYTGENCQTEIDECEPAPCLNSGTCVDKLGHYTCDCMERYVGSNCQFDNTPCEDVPCNNSATCENLGYGHYICHCTSNTRGFYCENVKPCLSNPCMNDGTCIANDITKMYECSCKQGYTGVNCETVPTESTTYDFTRAGSQCTWNEQIDGFKMTTSNIKVKRNVTIEQCKELCQDKNSCKSFEYKHTIKKCQLNSVTKDTKAEDYKADVNFYYYDYSCEEAQSPTTTATTSASTTTTVQPELTNSDFTRDGMECTWNAEIVDKKIKNKNSQPLVENISVEECKILCQNLQNCKSISIRDTATTQCKPKTVNKETSSDDYVDDDKYIYYDFNCVSAKRSLQKRDLMRTLKHSRRRRREANAKQYLSTKPEVDDTILLFTDADLEPQKTYTACMTVKAGLPRNLKYTCVTLHYTPVEYGRIQEICLGEKSTELVIRSTEEATFIANIMKRVGVLKVWANVAVSSGVLDNLTTARDDRCIVYSSGDENKEQVQLVDCSESHPHFCLNTRK